MKWVYAFTVQFRVCCVYTCSLTFGSAQCSSKEKEKKGQPRQKTQNYNNIPDMLTDILFVAHLHRFMTGCTS